MYDGLGHAIPSSSCLSIWHSYVHRRSFHFPDELQHCLRNLQFQATLRRREARELTVRLKPPSPAARASPQAPARRALQSPPPRRLHLAARITRRSAGYQIPAQLQFPTTTVSYSTPATGTVTFSGAPTGFPANCPLSSGTCIFSFNPSGSSGSFTITANYGGDTTHQASYLVRCI